MSHFITKIIGLKYKNLFSKDCLYKQINMDEYFQKKMLKVFISTEALINQLWYYND